MYARRVDYHKTVGKSLRRLARRMRDDAPKGHSHPIEARPYVDSGAVLDKAWARRAGIGFIGNNTLLIHPTRGSYSFLGIILTTLEMAPAPDNDVEPESMSGSGGRPVSKQEKDSRIVSGTIPQTDLASPQAGCGSCRRCIESCPTGALIEPRLLDASKCMSYLTIEHRGEIPEALKSKFTEWLFGCDICQMVCPYNAKNLSPTDRESPILGLVVVPEVISLGEVLKIDGEAEFIEKIAGDTPLRRAGLEGLQRNARILGENFSIPG